MQSIPLKRDAVISMFGTRAGNKLLQFLLNCCQTEPAITLSFNATCAGFDANGNPTYNVVISVTYNVSISGYTALNYYISTQPFTDATLPQQTGSIVIDSITAGVPVVVENMVENNASPGSYYVVLIDNRHNYSLPTIITYPTCPDSPTVSLSVNTATTDSTAPAN